MGDSALQVLYTTTVLNVLLIWSYCVINISITLSNFYEFRKVSAFRFTATLDITPLSATNKRWRYIGG